MPRHPLLASCAVLIGAFLLVGWRTGTASTPSSHDVTIVAHEYSYTAPPTLPPGLTTFHLVNRGHVTHEMQLFRFNRSVSGAAARRYLTSGDVPDSVADRSGSVLIAAPGDSVREGVTVRLVSGERYALMCMFRDAPSKPRHSSLGMFGLLEVR
ncbi:MAG TPA: hypothetical protein VE110_09870 [Gemmatimonadaceae bacterium]|jgi:hypothetical protein|nr:hypothetical protein [Gemmatimonadaceae bacterium]